MSMNGVPNYLNLLSWLATGMIFSLLYTVPIILILSLAADEGSREFIEYGSPFIVWLVMALNIGHIITFGMHVSAYFTRCMYNSINYISIHTLRVLIDFNFDNFSALFMVTGLIMIYVGSTVFMRYGVNVDSYEVIPLLGIIFPNMLLYRAWEEINFYEDMRRLKDSNDLMEFFSNHFNNLFR